LRAANTEAPEPAHVAIVVMGCVDGEGSECEEDWVSEVCGLNVEVVREDGRAILNARG